MTLLVMSCHAVMASCDDMSCSHVMTACVRRHGPGPTVLSAECHQAQAEARGCPVWRLEAARPHHAPLWIPSYAMRMDIWPQPHQLLYRSNNLDDGHIMLSASLSLMAVSKGLTRSVREMLMIEPLATAKDC